MSSSSPQPPDSDRPRIWRVSVVLVVPKLAQLLPGGGLPERLEFQSRLAEQTRTYSEMTVAIRKLSDDRHASIYGHDPQLELIELVADVPAEDEVSSVTKRLTPDLERLIDLISFEMGAALGVGQMTLLDVTPPLTVGEQRTSTTFTTPPLDRHARAIEMQAIQGLQQGRLPPSIDIQDSKTAAVLRWFVKALGTDLLHDQFIFLWIALEILADESETKIEEPYIGRCGHEIDNCPECQAPTTRMVRGATMRAFLESFGVSEEQAKELWRMRQLMHGAIPFDSEKLANLGALVQPLRAVVAAGLKARLGIGPAEAPIVALAGLAIHPTLAIGGTGEVTEDDLRPLAEP